MSKVLITADWHIRGDRPRCRVDEDWLASQREDIKAIAKIAQEKKVRELWILGDLFHQPRVSTEALNMCLAELLAIKESGIAVRILPGNHDLPYHDYGNLESSSVGVVLKSFADLCSDGMSSGIEDMYATPFGLEDEKSQGFKESRIWATHQLTFERDEDRPVAGVGTTAQELLDKFPGQLILTGDYHHGYIYTARDGRRVITPGCLNIQAADMSDYIPRCYVLDLDSLDAEEVVINGHQGDIVVDYLAVEKARDDRMEKVLQVVGDGSGVSLSFRDNLDKVMEDPEFSQAKQCYPELLDKLNKDRLK